MANKTVLQYVQNCLSVMDSDNVDAIAETAEAVQVANLLEDVYYELMNRQPWKFLDRPVTLTASGDSTKPTRFTVPEDMRELKNIWYNTATDGTVVRRELKWLDPQDFLNLTSANSTDSVLVTEGSQLQFYVRSDRMPTYYTSFDEVSIYCDSYDSDVESSLVSSKVSAWGVVIPAIIITDEAIPSIPKHMVPLLQATLNKAAFVYFKQAVSSEDVERERRQMAQARNRNEVVSPREYYYANQFGRR